MADKYLNMSGLSYFWGKVKALVNSVTPAKIGAVPAVASSIYNYTMKDLNSVNIDTEYSYNYIVPLSETGHGTVPFSGWITVQNFATAHFITQICTNNNNGANLARIAIRTKYITGPWGAWVEMYSTVSKPTAADVGAVGGMANNTTIYVATSGNDSTGDGSSGKPFASIQRAVNALPKDLNGFTAYINVAPGSYTGDTTVFGFFGGSIFVQAQDTANKPTIVGAMNIYHCSAKIFFKYFTMNTSGKSVGLDVQASPSVELSYLDMNGYGTNNSAGLYAKYGSNVVIERSNLYNYTSAVNATSASTVAANFIGGSGNLTGFSADGASIVGINNADLSATSLYSSGGGGRVYRGGQTNVPNY